MAPSSQRGCLRVVPRRSSRRRDHDARAARSSTSVHRARRRCRLVGAPTTNTSILTGAAAASAQRSWLLRPLVAGVVVGVLFIVKPILVRPRAAGHIPNHAVPTGRRTGALRVRREAICVQVRAPMPDARTGRLSGRARRPASLTVPAMPGAPRLVLTLGLPLAAGPDRARSSAACSRTSSGISRRAAACASPTSSESIKRWFSRVAHERDAWDEKLDEWSNRGNWMLSLTSTWRRRPVWCSRQVLAGLMKTGHAISCFHAPADGVTTRTATK